MAWNGSDNKVKSNHASTADLQPSTSRKHGLLAGLIVVALGGAAVWWFVGRTPPDSNIQTFKHSNISPIVEVTPQIATNKAVAISKQSVASGNKRMEGGIEVVGCSVQTNKSGMIVERLKLANGSTVRKVHQPKPIFRHSSDELIAMALSVKPGQSMPPFPDLTTVDKDFAKSLLDPIRIEESDSAKVKELKLAVKEARAYIAAEVKIGRTVAECLMAHRKEIERISDSHVMAVQEVQKMKREGATAEEIGEFRKRINEVFKEKGIPELGMPASDKNKGVHETRKAIEK